MPIHVFLGDDLYSMGRAIENIRSDGEFADVDVIRLDARQTPSQEVLMTIGTPGLFSLKRLVIVEGLGEQGKPGRKPAAKAVPEDTLTIEMLAEAVPESTTLVVIGAILRSDTALVKEARRLARTAQSDVRVREFGTPKQREMPRWIMERAREQGIKIDNRAAQQLALRVGDQVSIAGTELQKLATAAGPGGTVGQELVEHLVEKTSEESIFPLIDAIATGRRDAALAMLEQQIEQSGGNETDLSLRLLRLIARQFRLLLQIRLLLADGRKRQEIVDTLKLPEYFADRYFGQARRLEDEQLTRGIERLAATEQAIKTGEAGEAFLHLLLVELTESEPLPSTT